MIHPILQNQERPIENYCMNYLTNWTPDENDSIIMFFALKILIGLPVAGTVYIASFIWNRISDLICASNEIKKINRVSESIQLNIQTESNTKNVDFIESLSETEELKAPGYKIIEPDKNGRTSQRYLLTNRWALEQQYKPKSVRGYRGDDKLTQQQYESLLINSLEYKEFTFMEGHYVDDDGKEKDRKKWEEEHYLADYPMYYIHKKTTPKEFYKECAKRPTYQLHHGEPKIGLNTLTTSACRGNYKLLEELLKEAPELVNLENRNGITPLFSACMYKNKEVALDMARLLIENGANVNLTCFHSFIEMELLIESNSTPLSVAAKRGNEELVQLLLNHGAIIMRNKEDANTDEVHDFDEEDREIIVKITPENCPHLYGLGKIDLKFILFQARLLTEKKTLPLVNWGYSEKIPMDVLKKIVQNFQHLLKFY